MWTRTLLVFLFSLSIPETAPDKKPKEPKKITDECPLPKLVVKPCMVKKGQRVSLTCSIMEKYETPQNYSLYLGERHLKSEIAKGRSKSFNLSVSEDHDLGPYKCKVQVNNCSTVKYSAEFKLVFTGASPPRLNMESSVITKGQHVSLTCFTKKISQPLNYSLFRGQDHLKTEVEAGQLKISNITISKDGDLGPYKCRVQIPNSSCFKYSQEFNFTFEDPVATPVLNVDAIQTNSAQYIVTLRCISSQGSLPINYTFFESNVTLSTVSMNIREPAEIHITKNTRMEGTYKCKAKNKLPNHAKYSQPVLISITGEGGCPLCLQLLLPALVLVLIAIALILLCWQLPKHKARKAMRANVPKDNGVMTMEVTEYATICTIQADKESTSRLEPRQYVSTAQEGTDHSQEIHYATPIFQKVAPGKHEACSDGKTESVYSEVN
ncbi:allergin-1 [Echinops telfairi]|uniref:Allergin-1 n=2 Tax=Echinops telfairi TaxID=9371 RepID=A0AC59C6X6_ECHTE|nr:allergin-1 [Echinops telfairi]XP_045155857.1 allergin-1 [Echinops telfairi]